MFSSPDAGSIKKEQKALWVPQEDKPIAPMKMSLESHTHLPPPMPQHPKGPRNFWATRRKPRVRIRETPVPTSALPLIGWSWYYLPELTSSLFCRSNNTNSGRD